MDSEKNLVDGLTNRHAVADEENAGHGLAGSYAGVGKAGNGLAVVGEEDAVFSGGVDEEIGVGRRLQADILDTDDRQCGIALEQAIQDVAIEI